MFYDGDLHMTVEAWSICDPCDYRDGYSYGYTEMEIKGRRFGYYHGASMREMRVQYKRFRREVRHARRAYFRGYRPTGNGG